MRVFLVLALLFLLAPTAGAKLLRHASQVDPGTMDPHAIATLYNNRVLSQIYETLVGRDESLKRQPLPPSNGVHERANRPSGLKLSSRPTSVS